MTLQSSVEKANMVCHTRDLPSEVEGYGRMACVFGNECQTSGSERDARMPVHAKLHVLQEPQRVWGRFFVKFRTQQNSLDPSALL